MNFGQNLYQWFLSNAQSLVLMAIVVIGIYLGFKREFSKLIGFLVVALIAGRYKLWPKDRPYRTENFYKSISKKEVSQIAKNPVSYTQLDVYKRQPWKHPVTHSPLVVIK